MRRSFLDLTANSWVGALLALLAWGAVRPAEVQAGCSARYVTSRLHNLGVVARLDLPSLEAAESKSKSQLRPGPAAPCSGARCSQAPPPAPEPLLPAPSSDEDGRWMIPSLPVVLSSPGSFTRPPGDASLRPVRRADSIFHPPRPSSRFV